MADIETHVIRTGAPAETRKAITKDGEVEVVGFYGFEQQSYDDSKPDLPLSVTVWNPALHAGVLEKVYKGAFVAVQGTFKVDNVKGKTYRKMTAHRVGLVDWIPREKQEADDDDLEW